MPSGPQIILTLKILVSAVTVLLAASLVALAVKRPRLHGRINIVFFTLTLATVLGFELLLRLGTDVSSQFATATREALRIHLYFAIPSTALLPPMLFTGLKRRRAIHVPLGVLFAALWIGTFVTGVFFLPHE